MHLNAVGEQGLLKACTWASTFVFATHYGFNRNRPRRQAGPALHSSHASKEFRITASSKAALPPSLKPPLYSCSSLGRRLLGQQHFHPIKEGTSLNRTHNVNILSTTVYCGDTFEFCTSSPQVGPTPDFPIRSHETAFAAEKS